MALFRLVVVAALLMLLGAWASQATAHNNHVNKAKQQENVKFIKSFNKLGYPMPKQRRYSTDTETIDNEKKRIKNAVIGERPSSKSQEYYEHQKFNSFDEPHQPSPISKAMDRLKAKNKYQHSRIGDKFLNTLGTPVAEQPAPETWPPPQPMP